MQIYSQDHLSRHSSLHAARRALGRLMARALWIVPLSVITLGSQPALADVCLPTATGVPGMYLEAPDWWSAACAADPCALPQGRNTIDDPRWAGAMRESFPQVALSGTSQSQVDIRGISKGNEIYFSFQTHVDPSGTGATEEDAVYLALAKEGGTDCTDGNPATECARLLKVTLRTPNSGGASPVVATGSTASTDRILNEYRTAEIGGAWSSMPSSGVFDDVAVWVTNEVDQSGTWTVQLHFDRTALGLGTTFRAWAGVFVQHATSAINPTFVRYALPTGSAGAFGGSGSAPATPNAVVASDYTLTKVGDLSSCTTGVSLAWNQIGVLDGVGNVVRDIDDTENTFIAKPTYSGVSTTAGKVKAEFRLANWGTIAASSAAWDWVIASNVPNTGSGANPGDVPWNCGGGGGEPACPAVPAERHQCMLVTMSSTSGVTFLNDSAWTNMDFEDASLVERVAQIDIRHIAAHPKKPEYREVYLYVRARNMPATTRGPLNQKALAAAVRDSSVAERPLDPAELKRILAQQGNEPPKQVVNLAKAPGNLSAFETLAEVWPTYEVHAFYATGETATLGSAVAERLEPMMPFGLFVNHQGELFGWEHALEGVAPTVLEPLGPNWYRVTLKEGTGGHVRTKIEALETRERCSDCCKGGCQHGHQPKHEHKFAKVEHKHGCSHSGAPARSSSAWLFGLVALGALALGRRRLVRA